MTKFNAPLTTSLNAKVATTRNWRAPVLLLMALTQSACTAAVIGSGMADPFYDAVDNAAQKQLNEQYRQRFPGVDINDEYALQKAIVEEAKRDNPGELAGLNFPSRAEWEASNAKSASTATASAQRSSSVAATATAAAAPAASASRKAQDQARLKKSGTPWVVVTKSWPYDALNFSSVAPYSCGISRLQYSVNGAAMTSQAFSPCMASNPAPNPPYVTFPQGSIETVKVTVTFADGSRQTRDFKRDQIFQR